MKSATTLSLINFNVLAEIWKNPPTTCEMVSSIGMWVLVASELIQKATPTVELNAYFCVVRGVKNREGLGF